MKLTEEQKTEIRNYLAPIPKYRETYNELYDHILNSLADKEGDYSINEVILIVKNDFRGFSGIRKQEEFYRKDLGKKYRKQFRQEMINTFKWPGILANLCVLALCGLIYYSNDGTPFNKKPMFIAIVVGAIGVAVFVYSKVYINRYKYSKYSILDDYFGNSCLRLLFMMPLYFNMLINNNVSLFELGENGCLLILLFLFFFGSVYYRALIKMYTTKYKVLTT